MDSIDIVFVILHYRTYQDTMECIESIKCKIDTSLYRIVVVDNASGNGSGEGLCSQFQDDDKVTIIINKSNLGFSNGLNVGIEYANSEWDVNFIVAINNDTKVITENIVEVLNLKYQKYGFSVLGPMMITSDNKCSVNPIRNTIRSSEEVKQAIKKYQKLLKICNFHFYKMYYSLQKIKNIKNPKIDTNKEFLTDQLNYKLHGACWIFSKEYFKHFKGLDPSTFLYGEEDILYLHLMKNNMITLYTPDIIIYHKEDSSTNSSMKNEVEKMKFVSINCIKSLEIYLSLLEKYNG